MFSDDVEVEPTVAIIITTYNHAHYLAQALDSVLAQTRPPQQIIVVDDGSSDNPEEVTANYAGVRLIRQANGGLAAARNTGLLFASESHIIFLDADDRLQPCAIEAGLACFKREPEAAFVYGAHRRINDNGEALGADRFQSVGRDSYSDLLRGNLIAMHAAVMYRRDRLLDVHGFDPALRRCEDYDLYLRLAQSFPIASHPELVADYRWHGTNMSHNRRAMLNAVLDVHGKHWTSAKERGTTRGAWLEGRRNWRSYYWQEMQAAARASRGTGKRPPLGERITATLGLAPDRILRKGAGMTKTAGGRLLPPRLGYRLSQLVRPDASPPVNSVDFGDFAETRPISMDFGWDRGKPIDRHYVEAFLDRHRADIRGRVLEFGDDSYSRRFGGEQVARQDVVHIEADNPLATIVGDISTPGLLPEGAFDCIVFTQTLHLVYDMPAAMEQLHRALKPGGVLLMTVPGITQMDRGAWNDIWYWSLTPAAVRRLVDESFGLDNAEIGSNGNAFAATAFLQGVAFGEVDAAKLDVHDPAYPLIVSTRAVRAGD